MSARAIFAAVVAVLPALPVTAGAADIPGGPGTRATLAVAVVDTRLTGGVFERPGDSDWYRVSLQRGKHYHVAVNGTDEGIGVRAFVRSSRGKVLASGVDDPEVTSGFTFLAPYTGNYFVEYRAVGGRPGDTYGARVSTDCAVGTATSCTQRVGQTRTSFLASAFDADSFRAALSAGRTYTARAVPVEGCSSGFQLSIASLAGAILVSGGVSGESVVPRWRPPRDGTYLLNVRTQDDCSVVYTLSLATP